MIWTAAKSQRAAADRANLSHIILLVLILVTGLNAPAQTTRIDSRLEQAAVLIRDGQLKEAEDQLTSLLKSAPREPRTLNLLGTIRAQQGKLNEAEALFTRALRIDSRLVAAHMNLAYVSLLRGAPEKTIAELKAVISLEPENAEATYKLASLLLSQNYFDE